ncbi:MAG TPA: hypothetical protein VLH75_07280 [Longimicrobiales bacterium]|nr:hypothetical protein [Longimicrobiales bacterium]
MSERRGIRSRDRITILWGYCPHEVRAALRPILLDYLWLVPSWCQTLYVRWNERPEDGDQSAGSDAQPEYRQAQLTICPGWLSAVHQSRISAVVHELLHLPLAPMVIEHVGLTKRLLDDAERFHAYSEEQWRRVFEGAVQDLAAAVSVLPGPFPAVAFIEVEDDDAPSGAAHA